MYIVITHDTVKSIAFYCMEGGGVKRGGGGGASRPLFQRVIADSIAMV